MSRAEHESAGPVDASGAALLGLFLRIPLPILLCDRHGRVAAVNDAYVTLFSRAPVRGLDALSDPLFATRGLDDVIRRCLEGESSTCAERRYASDGVRGPRRPVDLAVEAIPLFDAAMTVSHAAIIFHDRTPQSQETDAFVRRIAKALPRLSHDLRSPLNAILGFAEILYERQVDPESPMHQEFLGDIVASGRRMLELVNEFDMLVRAPAELVSDEEP